MLFIFAIINAALHPFSYNSVAPLGENAGLKVLIAIITPIVINLTIKISNSSYNRKHEEERNQLNAKKREIANECDRLINGY